MKKIIFIGGCSRSGTTLIEMHFSRYLNILGLGEIKNLAQRGYFEDDKCGCGDYFSECKFWSQRFDNTNFNWEKFRDLSLYFNSLNGYFLYIFPIFRTNYWNANFKVYLALVKEIYNNLSKDSEIFFDSSKNPIYFLYLREALKDFSMYYLDVIRSPFGVVNSWSSIKVRDEARLKGKMKRYDSFSASILWSIYVIASHLVSSKQTMRSKIIYESFCDEPSDIPESLIKFIGTSKSNHGYHGVSGNPSRLSFEKKHSYSIDKSFQKKNLLWKISVFFLTLPGNIVRKLFLKNG